MKYPYIGKNESGTKALFFSIDNQVVLSTGENSALVVGHNYKSIIPEFYKDITHEYLQNTYGEVVSPEHSEFIIELGKNANAIISTAWIRGKYFNFYTSSSGELHLDFYDKELVSDSGERLITIPLPPKAESKFSARRSILNAHGLEVKLSNPDPLKNAGDNLILGCEQDFKKARAVASDLRKDMGCRDELLAKGDEWKVIEEDVKELDFISRAWAPIESKSDEWPQVGDEAITTSLSLVVILGIDRNTAWVRYKDKPHIYNSLSISNLSKPKTPEEELRDDLMDMATAAMSNKDFDLEHNCYYLVSGLMKKFNIKPQ